MKKREPEFILVPATFRERKSFWNDNPRTLEQIQAAEKESEERKRLAEDEKRKADEAFEAEKQRLEDERRSQHEQHS
jgi:hypothetical protein